MHWALFTQGCRVFFEPALKFFRLEPAEQFLLDFSPLSEELIFAARETAMDKLIVQIV